jgi:hypothetical protein
MIRKYHKMQVAKNNISGKILRTKSDEVCNKVLRDSYGPLKSRRLRWAEETRNAFRISVRRYLENRSLDYQEERVRTRTKYILGCERDFSVSGQYQMADFGTSDVDIRSHYTRVN